MLGRPQRASARAARHVSRGTASRSLFSLPPVHRLARQPQCCRHPLPVLIVRQPVHLHPHPCLSPQLRADAAAERHQGVGRRGAEPPLCAAPGADHGMRQYREAERVMRRPLGGWLAIRAGQQHGRALAAGGRRFERFRAAVSRVRPCAATDCCSRRRRLCPCRTRVASGTGLAASCPGTSARLSVRPATHLDS